MSRLSPALLLCCLLAVPGVQAQPGNGAGIAKRVTGQVLLERPGVAAQPLAPGQVLQVGDVVRTGPDGLAGITLADDTLLAAGPDSRLVIDTFAFNDTTHDGSILLRLWRGTLSVVTGLVARKSPEKMNVQTRTLVLGVRGTEFIVDAGQEAP